MSKQTTNLVIWCVTDLSGIKNLRSVQAKRINLASSDHKLASEKVSRRHQLNAEETDVEHVLETAYEWLDEHEIPPIEETDLTDQLYVGPATHDYLVLEYGILSRAELQNFAEGNPEEAKALLQEGALSDVESEG